jgi:putative CocE/NonD family hydrolase
MTMTAIRLRAASFALLTACLMVPLTRAEAQRGRGRGPVDSSKALRFDVTEVEIPMRDGVKLHTSIRVPQGHSEALPFILSRTPYGIGTPQALTLQPSSLEKDGYIFVAQDARGRYKSEGQFVMMRPARDKKDPKSVDEASDTYDTIDWLLKNVPHNNGRVGMTGTSYPAWLAVMAMLDPHPALKTVVPKASPADMYLGDDFHHQGAFRLSYGFEYATMMETTKERVNFAFDKPDLFDWYFDVGSLAHVNEKFLHGSIPTWNDFSNHSSYDAFWKRQSVEPALTSVRVPTLNIAGWWDQEDFYGPVTIYRMLAPYDTKHMNYLVVGPWNHGGWGGSGESLGPIKFGSQTAVYYRDSIEVPWFAYWLKDRGKLSQPTALTFESGSNVWRANDSWPPRNSASRNLYFHANGVLSFTAPTEPAAAAFDSYVADPANPVPYRKRPILMTYGPGSTWSRWLVDDQRFLQGRPDVLSWTTAPLTDDVVVAGDIAAHLFASTTGSDADWVVKLIDVYPESYPADTALAGYQLMVANDVLRGRFRKGFTDPKAITPNHVDEYTVDMHTQDYRFLKGHRIMVQVQSSWFPLIDRNPQTFVPNIFAAADADFREATQKIYRSSASPSHVQVAVKANDSK